MWIRFGAGHNEDEKGKKENVIACFARAMGVVDCARFERHRGLPITRGRKNIAANNLLDGGAMVRSPAVYVAWEIGDKLRFWLATSGGELLRRRNFFKLLFVLENEWQKEFVKVNGVFIC